MLDSLIITEDNMDSVYLWVVGLENDCGMAIILNTERGCNANGICEAFMGESWPTCTDCPAPLPNDLKLKVKTIKFKTDSKNLPAGGAGLKYQEAHLQGKYELIFGYAIINGPTTKHSFLGNFGSENDIRLKEKGYKAWGNASKCEIKRTNHTGSGKSNRGKEWDNNLNFSLANDYNPMQDTVLFSYYERDEVNFNKWLNAGGVSSNGKPYTWDGHDALKEIFPSSVPINSPSYNGIWVNKGTDIWEAHFPLDNEMEIIFELSK